MGGHAAGWLFPPPNLSRGVEDLWKSLGEGAVWKFEPQTLHTLREKIPDMMETQFQEVKMGGTQFESWVWTKSPNPGLQQWCLVQFG